MGGRQYPFVALPRKDVGGSCFAGQRFVPASNTKRDIDHLDMRVTLIAQNQFQAVFGRARNRPDHLRCGDAILRVNENRYAYAHGDAQARVSRRGFRKVLAQVDAIDYPREQASSRAN